MTPRLFRAKEEGGGKKHGLEVGRQATYKPIVTSSTRGETHDNDGIFTWCDTIWSLFFFPLAGWLQHPCRERALQKHFARSGPGSGWHALDHSGKRYGVRQISPCALGGRKEGWKIGITSVRLNCIVHRCVGGARRIWLPIESRLCWGNDDIAFGTWRLKVSIVWGLNRSEPADISPIFPVLVKKHVRHRSNIHESWKSVSDLNYSAQPPGNMISLLPS